MTVKQCMYGDRLASTSVRMTYVLVLFIPVWLKIVTQHEQISNKELSMRSTFKEQNSATYLHTCIDT